MKKKKKIIINFLARNKPKLDLKSLNKLPSTKAI